VDEYATFVWKGNSGDAFKEQYLFVKLKYNEGIRMKSLIKSQSNVALFDEDEKVKEVKVESPKQQPVPTQEPEVFFQRIPDEEKVHTSQVLPCNIHAWVFIALAVHIICV